MLFYEELMSVTDTLMMGKGYPENWNSTNVEVIGLAAGPNNLNSTKVDRLFNMSYESMKKKLGIGNRELYLKLENKTNIIGSLGTKDYNNSEDINTVSREGLMNGKKIKLSLIVWD